MTSAAAECQKALDNFNSHAHVERDELIVDGCKVTTISTHTLTWSVTRLSATLQKMYQYFNSHAHVERDLESGAQDINFIHFNSHAHVERDVPVLPLETYLKNFNSHAHVERDVKDNRYRQTCHRFQLTRSRGA